MNDIAELKRLAEAATPGPWAQRVGHGSVWSCALEALGIRVCVCDADDYDGENDEEADEEAEAQAKATAAYIATANPQTILALIKRLETLEECLKTMFGYMESGFLVRDTTHDSEPGWAIRMVRFTVDLEKCYRAISAPDAAELGKEAAAIKEANVAIVPYATVDGQPCDGNGHRLPEVAE